MKERWRTDARAYVTKALIGRRVSSRVEVGIHRVVQNVCNQLAKMDEYKMKNLLSWRLEATFSEHVIWMGKKNFT